MHRLPVLVLVPLALVFAACSSDDSGGKAVAIEASDSACDVADTTLDAGRTTFEVENKGDEVTEVYVYAEGDRVVTERENIGPGTKARFSANLSEGAYEIACKPGMKGDGIREDIHVHGEGGAAPAKAPDRTVEVTAKDYSFAFPTSPAVRAGETIEFRMHNEGVEEHEFEVIGPHHDLGEIGPTKAAKVGTAVITFAEAGEYTYVCKIEDHEARGMKGTLTVS